jgi:hypothetical protein
MDRSYISLVRAINTQNSSKIQPTGSIPAIQNLDAHRKRTIPITDKFAKSFTA